MRGGHYAGDRVSAVDRVAGVNAPGRANCRCPRSVPAVGFAPGQRGFSYVEVLVATFIMAIALVPAIEALQGGIQATAIHGERAEIHYRLTGKMEEMLARPFAELGQQADAVDGNTAIVEVFSDSVGTDLRRLVYLARLDGDNADADNNPFTGADDGLIWLQVRLEGTDDSLETVVRDGLVP